MESTMPIANFQPHKVQYTPADRSMLNSVPALVSPNSSNLAFVRRNTIAKLNFASSAPRAPSPAAPLPHREVGFAPAGWFSTARLRATMRAATAWCWVESLGSRSSAWRQAPKAPLASPAWPARSASAARRLSPSAWTRRWQDGHASNADATCVPHCGQAVVVCPRDASLMTGRYAAAGDAEAWYGPLTRSAPPRLSFHAA